MIFGLILVPCAADHLRGYQMLVTLKWLNTPCKVKCIFLIPCCSLCRHATLILQGEALRDDSKVSLFCFGLLRIKEFII